MKELKLIIDARNSQARAKGFIEHITPLELAGLYAFLKEESKNKYASLIGLHIKLIGDTIHKKEVVYKGRVPVSEIYKELKQDALRKIKKTFSIKNE